MSAARPIYILDNVPGAPEGSQRWEAICHRPRFLVITHEQFRSGSPFSAQENKRSFIVRDSKYFEKYAASATLSGALKIAIRIQKELAE